jgi:hypothetical protein
MFEERKPVGKVKHMANTAFLKKFTFDAFLRRDGGARAPQPTRLNAPHRFPYGAFKFNVATMPNAEFEIQASSDFKNWTTIERAFSKTETLEYLDSSASKFSYRFYRTLSGDVRSANMVGYATITVPPGHSMVANPFHAVSNTVTDLFKGLPEGTALTKFNTRVFQLNENYFRNGRWTNPGETLVPGEGAILFNPTSDYKPLNFVGEVMEDEYSLPIPAGFSIRSSLVPLAGRLHEDLGFPVSEGDIIHVFDNDRQKYILYPYNDAAKWAANPPTVNACEAFWVEKVSPKTWNRPNLRRLGMPA